MEYITPDSILVRYKIGVLPKLQEWDIQNRDGCVVSSKKAFSED